MVLSSISIGIINHTVKKNRYLVRTKIHFFLICLLVISIRMFIPFDFPFVHVFKVSAILPNIYFFLYDPILLYKHFAFSIFDIFTFIWLSGSAVCVIKMILSYFFIRRTIHKLSKPCKENLNHTLQKVLGQYKVSVCFQLVISDQVTIPLVFGILNPYIVLPDITLNDEEWYYILSHEIAHYYHGDLIVKFMLELFHAVCWWNPLYYFIKHQISKLLEVNTDIKVTQNYDEIQTLSYVECLLKIAAIREEKNEKQFIALFNGDGTTAITKRVHIIIDDSPLNARQTLYGYLIMIILLLCVIIFPYIFTIAPHSIPDYIKEEGFLITHDNAFFIQLEDGTYDLYVDHEFIINTATTDIFEEQIIIYQISEEVISNEMLKTK